MKNETAARGKMVTINLEGNSPARTHPKSVANSRPLAYNPLFNKTVEISVGYFITFEGIEGCGKTTQIKLLGNHLNSLGYSVAMTREPGGCPIADKIRAILLDADNAGLFPLAELLLYAAARAQHVSDVILPALKAGSIVLCDRFTDATIAYQSAGRGIERSTIDSLNNLACQTLRPDLTILIDCEASVGLGRARSRIDAQSGPREERFELEALEFHQRVRDGYLAIARQEPRRFIRVDGSGSIEEISASIADQVLQKRLNNSNHASL
jgi:dTMP kinase